MPCRTLSTPRKQRNRLQHYITTSVAGRARQLSYPEDSDGSEVDRSDPPRTQPLRREVERADRLGVDDLAGPNAI